MKKHKLTNIHSFLLIVFGLGVTSLACGMSEDVLDQTPEPIPTAGPISNGDVAQSDSASNEVGYPELILNFAAENWNDLPVYRATMSYPVVLKNDQPDSQSWPANLSASRSDDNEKLGGLQPGTVNQESTFSGDYDPQNYTLVGVLTHSYNVHQLASGDYLESQDTYSMSCELTMARVAGTNTLQGQCSGSMKSQHIVPSEPSFDSSEERAVSLQVSAEIPAELLTNP